MNKYVEVKALEKAIIENAQDLRTLSTKTVGQAISSLPTIDIVRCKDCTFAKPTNTENVIKCTWLSGYTFRKDHYCSAGERIEE